MKGYAVEVTIFVEADDDLEAYFRAEKIMTGWGGKRGLKYYHGSEVPEIEDTSKYTVIPELGA